MAPKPGGALQTVAAHQVVVALAVGGRVGVHRADDRELVGTGGHVGHQLAKFQAGNPGDDRAEFSADLGRGQRLQIVHVDVAGAAEHPQQDAVDRLVRFFGSAGDRLLSPQGLGQAQSQGGQATDPQQFPATQVAERFDLVGGYGKHRRWDVEEG